LRSGVCGVAAQQLALSASSLNDIFGSILSIAQAIGMEEKGKAIVRREQERLEKVRQEAAHLTRKTVVLLEWTDPLFAMGNWGPELVEIANGELLLGSKGQHSAAIPAEKLRHADPEYLIVAPCGFNLERSLREQALLERHSWWPELQSVRKNNVVFADGNLFFNRSGMTVSQTAEIIAEILHGRPFGEKTEGLHWQRMEQFAGRHLQQVQ
jgi:iron complex transport system substrate-binding protein